LASAETHLPKALRSFEFLPYFARNASPPSVLRSALHCRAAFSVSWRSSAEADLAFEETHLPKAFAPLGPVP
jgi:hypothetical protein